MRFADSPGIRDRVAAIMAAEGDCCAFLSMTTGAEAGAVVLTIEASGGGEAALEEMVTAFGGDARSQG